MSAVEREVERERGEMGRGFKLIFASSLLLMLLGKFFFFPILALFNLHLLLFVKVFAI